ncbi:MAG: hydroxylamine reductase [Filifactoraceae bacterium]
MKESMFCFQCQETVGNSGCTKGGVCGKKVSTANFQDVLIDVTKGFSEVLILGRKQGLEISEKLEDIVSFNLFVTITNANFDDEKIVKQIIKTVELKKELISKLANKEGLSEIALWSGKTKSEIEARTKSVGILLTENQDIRSLKELITYGLKGMAAYNKHAHALGKRNKDVDNFIQETLVAIENTSITLEELISLTIKTGEYGVKAMALLDEANNSSFGHPEISSVNIGVRNKPAILVSGHDLKDLEQLLEQTKASGVDVYTHSEMLPANYYPFFKKYDNLVGNYGNAWWKQKEEFETFNGPILFTTNCIVPPKESYKDRVYTTGAAGFEGCKHIFGEIGEKKDFSELIEHAKQCEPPREIEQGTIVGGFAHNQVFALADKVVDAVKSGAIKKFVVMAGCDGRHKERSYYEDFAKELPKDTVILTAGCAKYRYNKLNLGDIGGIPRVLDAGQCNDSYSLALIALKLKEVFELQDINDLPIIYNIAWYEQKAVIVLLALLSLGVKNIHLGPTLPAFLSPTVASFLVENFGIAGIKTAGEDLENFFS